MARTLSAKPSAAGRILEAAASKAALEAGARAELANVDPGGVEARPAIRAVEPKRRASGRVKVAG
ncbi:MAG: hypothetical protein ABUS57_22000 [Pseudomonadota bacterium]